MRPATVSTCSLRSTVGPLYDPVKLVACRFCDDVCVPEAFGAQRLPQCVNADSVIVNTKLIRDGDDCLTVTQ